MLCHAMAGGGGRGWKGAHLEWQGKAINQVEFTGKPSENCQSPGSDDEDGDVEQTGTGTGTETATGPQRAALSTSNVGF